MRSYEIAVVVLLLVSGCSTDKNTGRLKQLSMTLPEKGIISENQGSTWEESLLTGNGTIGLTVLSHPLKDRIIFGHEYLFLPITPKNRYFPVWKNMGTIRALILNGKSGKADSLVVEQGKKYGYTETVWTNPLIPAGEMQIQFNEQDTVISDYLRSVNYETGEAVISYKSNNHVVQRRMFVSRENNTAVTQLYCPQGGKVNFRIRLAQLPFSKSDQEIGEKCIRQSVSNANAPFAEYTMEFNQFYPGAIKGVSIVSKVIAPGAQISSENGFLIINNAESAMILSRVKIFGPSETIDNMELKSGLNEIVDSYETLLERHAFIHSEMFKRLTFSVGKQENVPVNQENQVIESSLQEVSLHRIQDVFNACRYELVSSTGKLPPTLQGIWGGTWRPAWSNDFTQDGNVQAVISGALSCNYFEAIKAYLDYMTRLMPDFRNNAMGIFNLPGIWVPTRTSEHGQILHFNRNFPGLFWMAGAAWVSQYYYDYWKYTSDTVFLKEQAVPFMLEAARFYEHYLIPDVHGKLMVIPSYSPENVPLNEKSGSVINATMDVASVKQLLTNLLEIARTVSFENDEVLKWKSMIEKLPGYAVDRNGALKEWIWPDYSNFENHRHASHLYPLFFGVDPEIRSNAELITACKEAIEKRLEYRRKRKGGEMAFGLVQLGLAAANLRDTVHAEECVQWLCRDFWTSNLNSFHDPGKIFNVDISGGLPAVVVQMLLQSDGDNIELLPVLPDKWDCGSVNGIRAKGGFTVDISWSNHELQNVRIQSLSGKILTLSYKGKTLSIHTVKGETYSFSKKDF